MSVTTTEIPPTAGALIPIHMTSPQQVTSMQHQINIPQNAAVLTSDPSITSDPHTSQPGVMSHIELQTSQPTGVVSYPSPHPTITSTIMDHPPPPQFTPLPHQSIIHTPGTGGSIPHTHHPQLSSMPSYQPVRPVLTSQLSPSQGTSTQQVQVDFHQVVRPLESQQLEMSDEQLTTLAGVASALFGGT